MSHLLGAETVSLAYPNRRVLNRVSLGISAGDRIGIVGRNGDGKSTLLKLLANQLKPDQGRVTCRGDISIGHLEQGDTLDPAIKVGQALVGSRPEHEWAGDARIRAILKGLVGELDFDQSCGHLSGGQRRRVALTAVLIAQDDVLLLDEPTNHLDLEAITWLASHLRQRWSAGTGAVAVVTHDRWFLDAVCNLTWEVHDGQVEPFDGGYAAYVLQRLERDRQSAAIETRRRNILRKELAWLRRGAPARTSKPKFRLDAASRLIASEPPPRDRLELARLATARLGKDVIDLVNVDFAYDSARPVLQDLTWLIGPGERTGLLGPNGAGKTTLLSLVTGALSPSAGRVKIGATVKVASLTQDFASLETVADQCPAELIDELRRDYTLGGKLGWTGGGRDARLPGGASGEIMSPSLILERLGFSTAHLRTPVRDLSGGQRRRLQLALVLMAEPNVLILDEPSNDLDTDMLAALEDLLDAWPGTLLVVTHDRYLMERITDQQFAVLDGQLRHLPGGVEEYLQIRQQTNLAADGDSAVGRVSAIQSRISQAGEDDGSELTPSGAKIRAARKALTACERKLTKLRDQLAQVHQEMAEHDQADYIGLDKLLRRSQKLDQEIAQEEDKWLELADFLG